MHVSGLAGLLSITELMHSIIERLDDPVDLRNVRLASKQFNDLAVVIIYRSLHLDFTLEYFLSTVRFICIERRLKPYVNLVQDLSVRFEHASYPRAPDCKWSKECRYCCAIVVDLLQTLPALRHFR